MLRECEGDCNPGVGDGGVVVGHVVQVLSLAQLTCYV